VGKIWAAIQGLDGGAAETAKPTQTGATAARKPATKAKDAAKPKTTKSSAKAKPASPAKKAHKTVGKAVPKPAPNGRQCPRRLQESDGPCPTPA
jgi:hypothetical protein